MEVSGQFDVPDALTRYQCHRKLGNVQSLSGPSSSVYRTRGGKYPHILDLSNGWKWVV